MQSRASAWFLRSWRWIPPFRLTSKHKTNFSGYRPFCVCGLARTKKSVTGQAFIFALSIGGNWFFNIAPVQQVYHMDFVSGIIQGMEINCSHKGQTSKGVLPREIRRISEESPGIHTDQSHQSQLYEMTNIHVNYV